jgi:uncharacterized membrane protein
MSDHLPRAESSDVDRLIFFSDAVVAIAMTLLALELPVPTGRTVGDFWHSVRDNDGHYAAFLISFVAIASMWAQHHRVFGYAVRADSRLRTLSMVWLLMIVLNPFATKLLTDGEHDTIATHAIRFGFYAVLQVFAAITFLAMVHHLVSSALLSPQAPAHLKTITDRASYEVTAGFAISIPVFFLTTYAWVLWIVVPPLLARFGRWRRRRVVG